MKVQSTHQAIF